MSTFLQQQQTRATVESRYEILFRVSQALRAYHDCVGSSQKESGKGCEDSRLPMFAPDLLLLRP